MLTARSSATGVYFDENGRPMRGSRHAHDPAFQDRYVAESRAFLATIPVEASPVPDRDA